MNSSSPVSNKLSHVQLMQRVHRPACNYTPRLSIFHGTAFFPRSAGRVSTAPARMVGRTDSRSDGAALVRREGEEGRTRRRVRTARSREIASTCDGNNKSGVGGAFLSISLNHPEAANSIFSEWTKLRIRSTEPLLALTAVRWVPIANMFLGPGRPAVPAAPAPVSLGADGSCRGIFACRLPGVRSATVAR